MLFFGSFVLALIIQCHAQTFVDLGHEMKHDGPYFPVPEYLNNRYTLTILRADTKLGFWVAINSFCAVEHSSTHIDAPYHFFRDGWTVEQIPVEHLIAHAVVIDVTSKAAKDPNYLISAADVEEWVAENGIIPNNSVIIGRTGWSKKYNDNLAYLGSETDTTKLRFPGFGVEAIKQVMKYKTTQGIHVVGFGVDTVSLDHGPNEELEAHQIVLGANLYIIENLNNLEVLPPKGATLIVMPMKIPGGSGAPARVIAQLPSQMTQKTSIKSAQPSAHVMIAAERDPYYN